MRNLIGYLKTIKNYLQTSKGKHDVTDYLRAVIIIVFTTIVIIMMLKIIPNS